MVNERQAVAVVACGHVTLGDGEANGGGDALAERAGGEFDARGVVVFGVAGGFAVQLAEVFQVVQREVVAGEVQRGVLQHGGVAVGENEAVTVVPLGVGRVDAQVFEPEDGSHVGHAHRCAGVTGVGFLYRVHAEDADGCGEGLQGGHKRSFCGLVGIQAASAVVVAGGAAGASSSR